MNFSDSEVALEAETNELYASLCESSANVVERYGTQNAAVVEAQAAIEKFKLGRSIESDAKWWKSRQDEMRLAIGALNRYPLTTANFLELDRFVDSWLDIVKKDKLHRHTLFDNLRQSSIIIEKMCTYNASNVRRGLNTTDEENAQLFRDAQIARRLMQRLGPSDTSHIAKVVDKQSQEMLTALWALNNAISPLFSSGRLILHAEKRYGPLSRISLRVVITNITNAVDVHTSRLNPFGDNVREMLHRSMARVQTVLDRASDASRSAELLNAYPNAEDSARELLIDSEKLEIINTSKRAKEIAQKMETDSAELVRELFKGESAWSDGRFHHHLREITAPPVLPAELDEDTE